jgi:hypothetical protein
MRILGFFVHCTAPIFCGVFVYFFMGGEKILASVWAFNASLMLLNWWLIHKDES